MEEILIGDYNPDSEKPDSRPVSHCVVAAYDENLLITGALPNTSASSELMANAALIAASPMLYEALSGMLENYLELKRISLALARSDRPNFGRGVTKEDDIHVIAARAAIAAAEGGK